MDTPPTPTHFPGAFPKGQIHDLCPQRHKIPCHPAWGVPGRGETSWCLIPSLRRKAPCHQTATHSHQGAASRASGPPGVPHSDFGAGFPILSLTLGCHW